MKSRIFTKNEASAQADAIAGLVRASLSRDRLPKRPTPEQIAELSAVREAWLQADLSTCPAYCPEAEAGVHDAYREAQLDPPDHLIWLASPLQGVIAASEFWSREGSLVRDQIWNSVWERTRERVWSQVFAHVADPITYEIGSQLEDIVWDQICALLEDHALGPLRGAIPGPHTVGWLSSYDVFDATAAQSNVMPSVRGLMRVARSAGWWWPFKRIAILTDRPSLLRRGAQNRLHSDDGPALSYRDGFAVYASHGARIPNWVIEPPQTITLDLIDAEQNGEIWRVMVERYKHCELVSGAASYIRDAECDLLDDDPRWERLYRRRRPGEDNLILVQVTNATQKPGSSIQEYCFRVHPGCRPVTLGPFKSLTLGRLQKLTSLNAIASTFGMTGKEYVRLSMER